MEIRTPKTATVTTITGKALCLNLFRSLVDFASFFWCSAQRPLFLFAGLSHFLQLGTFFIFFKRIGNIYVESGLLFTIQKQILDNLEIVRRLKSKLSEVQFKNERLDMEVQGMTLELGRSIIGGQICILKEILGEKQTWQKIKRDNSN